MSIVGICTCAVLIIEALLLLRFSSCFAPSLHAWATLVRSAKIRPTERLSHRAYLQDLAAKC